jgi:hypothetical protein
MPGFIRCKKASLPRIPVITAPSITSNSLTINVSSTNSGGYPILAYYCSINGGSTQTNSTGVFTFSSLSSGVSYSISSYSRTVKGNSPTVSHNYTTTVGMIGYQFYFRAMFFGGFFVDGAGYSTGATVSATPTNPLFPSTMTVPNQQGFASSYVYANIVCYTTEEAGIVAAMASLFYQGQLNYYSRGPSYSPYFNVLGVSHRLYVQGSYPNITVFLV